MTRRGGQLPGGARRRPLYGGPTRRPNYSRAIVLGGIVLGVALLGWWILGQCRSGGGCDDAYCASDRSIAVPEGYERVSRIYTYQDKKGAVPAGNSVIVGVPLLTAADSSANLSFYSYNEESQAWEPLASAALDSQSKRATANLASTPKTIAVLKRLSPAGQVAAYLPHITPPNGQLHPDAVGRITILHTRDFVPSADGGIEGTLSEVTPKGFAWYPSIWLEAGTSQTQPIIGTILQSSTTRSAHVQQIAQKVASSNLAGIDIAYLNIPADQRTSFTLFIQELAQVLHSQQKTLTLTLPAPLLATDRVDEGAYDWAELGKVADLLQMQPYRDQNRYRTAMPQILEHLTAIVNPAKIVLTVSPYATQQSPDGFSTLLLTDAMKIATSLAVGSGSETQLNPSSNVDIVGTNIDRSKNLSGITWYPEIACVGFTYQARGNYTIWLENFFSIGFKLEFITRYKLGGVGIEDASANSALGNIWTALVPFITSGQPILLQPNQTDLNPEWQVSDGQKEVREKGSILHWFTPQNPGTYTVKLRLSDGVAFFENEIQVTLTPKATPSPTASASRTPTN